MAFLDHRRTWQFTVQATPQDCVEAFITGLTTNKLLRLLGSKWDVRRKVVAGLPSAAGLYRGRTGAGAAAAILSRRSDEERQAALGSELSFRITGHDAESGRTRCAMALTRSTQVMFFFIADARFLRAAMNRVAAQLRSVDPTMTITKV
ncbi:hypothetical protein [Micromonospora sp. NPDC023737]|uniref:hypothetical protein n=1 Tax=unclassified Micromonospora TaxID=2617518 RepID=UPI0033E15EB7